MDNYGEVNETVKIGTQFYDPIPTTFNENSNPNFTLLNTSNYEGHEGKVAPISTWAIGKSISRLSFPFQ